MRFLALLNFALMFGSKGHGAVLLAAFDRKGTHP
jgi:hypothetical protein